MYSCQLNESLVFADDIIHDAEYYILEAQYGEQWTADDKGVEAKLAEFRVQTLDFAMSKMWAGFRGTERSLP